MTGDFTDGASFSNYLSSFWSQMFSDPEMVSGIGDAFARQLAQHYQDFAETVNSTSVAEIAPFHTELVYPIFIRQSEFSTGPRLLNFGDGGLFGPQPAGGRYKEGQTLNFGERAELAPVYYVDLPDDVVDTGSLILNRLHNPSVILVNGSDFVFQDGVVVFKEDIFANDLIAKRKIAAADGSVDSEIVLWATNAQIEKFQLYRCYGHLFFGKEASGTALKAALQTIFRLYSDGPSIAHLDSFIAAAAGFPISSEAVETVESIDVIGSTQVVVTDKAAYRIPAGLTLRESVVTGAVLKSGAPFTTATEVSDRFSSPLWWTEIDGLTVDRGLTMSGIAPVGFLNTEVQVTLDNAILVDGNPRRPCRFYLAGTETNVNLFWDKTKELNLEADEFLSEILWKQAGLVDGNGDPDYSQDLYTNPMRLLNDLIGDNLILVKINDTISGDVVSMLRLLRQTIPAFCTVIVLINLSVEDNYSMVSSSDLAVEIEELPFVEGRALFINDIDSFDPITQAYWQDTDLVTRELLTKTAEAISLGVTPIMSDFVDDIDLSDANVYAETVTARLEPVC